MVIIAILAMAAQTATPHCTQASEYEPVLCPSRLPAARSVVVEKNALRAWREKVQPVSCRSFVVNARQIMRYLQLARKTDAQSVHYALPESPCYSIGRSISPMAERRDGRSINLPLAG